MDGKLVFAVMANILFSDLQRTIENRKELIFIIAAFSLGALDGGMLLIGGSECSVFADT